MLVRRQMDNNNNNTNTTTTTDNNNNNNNNTNTTTTIDNNNNNNNDDDKNNVNKGVEHEEFVPTYSIHLRDLSPSITEDDLKSVFIKFGDIYKVNIIHTRRYGFVNFLSQESRDKVLEKTEYEIRGKLIKVYKCLEKTSLFLGGLPQDIDPLKLQQKIEEVTFPIAEITLKNGFGFVRYEDHNTATRALQLLQNFKYDDHIIQCSIAKSQQINNDDDSNINSKLINGVVKTLYIKNIDVNTTEEKLSSLFEPYGTICTCKINRDKINRDNKCFGFIEFENEQMMQEALKSLNGKELEGQELQIEIARRPTGSKGLRRSNFNNNYNYQNNRFHQRYNNNNNNNNHNRYRKNNKYNNKRHHNHNHNNNNNDRHPNRNRYINHHHHVIQQQIPSPNISIPSPRLPSPAFTPPPYTMTSVSPSFGTYIYTPQDASNTQQPSFAYSFNAPYVAPQAAYGYPVEQQLSPPPTIIATTPYDYNAFKNPEPSNNKLSPPPAAKSLNTTKTTDSHNDEKE